MNVSNYLAFVFLLILSSFSHPSSFYFIPQMFASGFVSYICKTTGPDPLVKIGRFLASCVFLITELIFMLDFLNVS